MKSDNTWDLGTEGGQQLLLVLTAGITAAYAEQAHKVTLNASSDIFAVQQPPNMRHEAELNHFLAADLDDHAEG